MTTATWFRRTGWLGALTLAACTVSSARADEPQQPEIADAAADDVVISTVRPISKYNLKVSLTRVPKALDAQLKLDGEGALVAGVVKGGPADKAGLKPHDVVIAAAGAPVKRVVDVVKAVNDSDGEKIELRVVRGGDPIKIVIAPENVTTLTIDSDQVRRYRRKAEEAAEEATRKVEIELRQLEDKIQEKLKDLGVDLRMQVIRPGQIVADKDDDGQQRFWLDFVQNDEFPEDLNIVISKSGKKPVKIKVRRGDDSWDVTEKELDELPKDVRRHVEKLLGSRGISWNWNGAAGKTYRYQIPEAQREKIEAATRFARERARAAREVGERTAREARQQAQEMAERYRQQAEAYREQAERAAEEYREQAELAAKEARERGEKLRDQLQDSLNDRLEEMTREMQELRKRLEDLGSSLSDDAGHESDDESDADDNAKPEGDSQSV